MQFGVSLPNYGHLASKDGIARIAVGAEQLGFSSVWAAERLIVPVPPNQSWSQRDPTAFEPLTTLTYIAGLTRRIRLGTSVIILPVRNPVLLARESASLDVLSGGRLDLGIGIGWMRQEMEVSLVPFGERGRIADEYILLMRAVWQGLPFQGRLLNLPQTLFMPAPLNASVPIWVGGDSDAALRRAARLGDGWIPMAGFSPEDLKGKVDAIMDMRRRLDRKGVFKVCCKCGVKPSDLQSPQPLINLLETYGQAGATQIVPRFEADEVASMAEMMERFASAVLPCF